MIRRLLPLGLLAAGYAAGMAADRPMPAPARTMGGYHVLAADFHVHTLPFGWHMLLPREVLSEARYNGLDAIAMTPHDQVWQADVARWFAERDGGPILVKGEEITTPGYHLLALGIDHTIPNTLPLANAIAAVHAQGGVAVAAHPYHQMWSTYTDAAIRELDGTEVVRPESLFDAAAATDLRTVFARKDFTAFGNSDYHGTLPIGYSRTYVFALERSPRGVLDALRAGRTVVYDGSHAFGNADLIRLAGANGGLPHDPRPAPRQEPLAVFSRVATVAALAAMVLFNRR